MNEIKQKPRLHATWIDHQAIEIVERLQRAGYTTYLVGGCVRDLLAGIVPKDYDIATSALPNEVRKRVWGSYVIGRRFRLVLAKRGNEQFEIATFRREGRAEDFTEGEDAPIGDNFFGTPEEDAKRRDFTINALFYDPIKGEILDFIEGMKDIENRTLRIMGDPKTRLIEDAIRSLRAVRLSHKLKFQIEPSLRAAIQETSVEVGKSALPRRREEYLKFMRLKDLVPALCELFDLKLMDSSLPTLKFIWDDPNAHDIFINYLYRRDEIIKDYSNPLELYLLLTLAFNAALASDPNLEKKREILMRDELGVFKAESAEILHIIEMSRSLPSMDSFKKRGARRQSSFLSQMSFPLSLRVAKMELALPPAELSFWENTLALRGPQGHDF